MSCLSVEPADVNCSGCLSFMRVLEAIPETGLGYRPHDRSPSTQQLVWTLTHELRSCLEAATQFRTEWRGDSPPSFPEMLALFSNSGRPS